MTKRDDFDDDDFLDPSSDSFDFAPITSEEKKGGKAVKFLVVTTVLGAIAGGAWYWAGMGSQSDEGLPLVRAGDGPTKLRPLEPGGMEIPNRDKTVYDRVSGADTNSVKVERLLPRPEEPVSVEEVLEKASETPPLPAQTDMNGEQAETPSMESVEQTAPPLPPQINDPNAPLPLVKRRAPELQAADKQALDDKIAETLQEETTAKAVAAPVAPIAPVVPKPVSKIEEAKKVAPAPTKVSHVAPTPKPQAPVQQVSTDKTNTSNGYVLQLLSSKNKSGVEAEWTRIQKKNADLLKNLPANIVKADLGDKGVYYRLRLGPVAQAQTAKNYCSELKKRKVGCFIVRAQ